MTWNDFKKALMEVFGKEPEVDTSGYVESENQLNSQLKDIADKFEATYDPAKGYADLSDVLPEEIEYVYRVYEGDDEQAIKDNTNQKYQDLLEADSKILNDKYDVKVGEVEGKKQTASEESAIKSTAIDEKYAELEKAILNNLVQRGLYNSSIKSSQKQANQSAKQSDLDALDAELKKKLNTYDAQIEKLRGEENVALEQLDLSYAQKLESEIQSLLDKRAKEIASIDAYNNTLKEKELKYMQDRTNAIEAQLTQRLKDEQAIKALENRNGYAGEKAENYTQRYNLAFDYYNSLPKNVAMKMIQDNSQLKLYLGYYYNNLLVKISNKKD